MKKRLLQATLLAMTVGLIWISSSAGVIEADIFFAESYERDYNFTFQHERYWSYWPVRTLYVSVPPSLYDYYQSSNHRIYRDSDYAKFVTPEAVDPIAERIQSVTRDLDYSDEQFANAVLTLVHQIPYAISGTKYPVETLVDNFGDCGALSLLASSIMKAGGLDVVLIHYTGIRPGHINVGVYLPHTPVYSTWWMSPIGFEYDNKTYWVAEATPGRDWKVGDQAWSLGIAKPVIISLENVKTSCPAQVSSSLGTHLNASSISVNLSSEKSNELDGARALLVSGSISPAFPGESVVMYVSDNRSSYSTFRAVTDDSGSYSFLWNYTSTGTYYLKTSWSGSSEYTSVDSETLTVFIGPPLTVQFKTPSYSYVLGRTSARNYELRSLQGVEEFLNVNLTGTGVLLSGEFIVLRGEQALSNVQTQTIKIPGSEQIVRLLRSRQPILVIRPEQTVTIVSPIDVPEDMRPLRLPADFNRTINSNFGFVLQSFDKDDYCVGVRGMDYYEIDHWKGLSNGNMTAFIDVSTDVRENMWYRLAATLSEEEAAVDLFDADNMLLKNLVIENEGVKIGEFGIVLAIGTDAVIVFRNLRIESFDQFIQPAKIANDDFMSVDLLRLAAPYFVLLILLVVAVKAVVYIKRSASLLPDIE
jgi:hypothetical protein